LPPILTELAVVVGARVPVTRYGVTGTPDFGQSVLEVLAPDTRAVLLKNHGLVCFGRDFSEAMTITEIVEEGAKIYVNALAANGGNEPDLVPLTLIAQMQERFRTTYGQRKE
jgi:L-fuculose-phosphate aldolase